MNQNLKKSIKRIMGAENFYNLRNFVKGHEIKKSNFMLYANWKNNRNFKNCYKGKRCFIVGNGPSLKKVDLVKLQNEFVITVNKINLLDNYEELKTNVHIWVDGAFFQQRKDHVLDYSFLMKCYDDIAKENPICFVPLRAYPFMKDNLLEEKLNLNYFNDSKSLADDKVENIDLVSGIYSGTNVIHYAIQIAIYMGFREIYLVGCDATNIIAIMNIIQGKSSMKIHVYDNDNSENDYKKLMESWEMSDVLYDQYIVFLGYKKLNSYCHKNNIKLFNCSEETLITEIPHKSLDTVLHN